MTKLKTNSGASKRFRVTANGGIKRKSAYRNHILNKKENEAKTSFTGCYYDSQKRFTIHSSIIKCRVRET